ncbi:MAG: hypothetical protein K0T00_99 [Gaiellaceae bacterium]|jgi:hypothetical protein|nr:hypothetical protein [Gaiellaceae bacterium]
MALEKTAALLRQLLLLVALALLVVLFLDWRVASVSTPTVELSSGSSGIAGWGLLAAVLLVVFIARELWLLGRKDQPGLQQIAVSAALALGAAGFTWVGFVTGDASVDVAGVVAVHVEDVQPAAYAGLALAVVLAVLAIVRYVAEARAHPAPPRTTAHPSV